MTISDRQSTYSGTKEVAERLRFDVGRLEALNDGVDQLTVTVELDAALPWVFVDDVAATLPFDEIALAGEPTEAFWRDLLGLSCLGDAAGLAENPDRSKQLLIWFALGGLR